MADFPTSVWGAFSPVDLTWYWTAARVSELTDEVVAVETFLISTTRTENTIFAGPTSAPAAAADFRALVAADIPNLDTSKITSGTFDDARIAESNVTQHQAALAIGGDQVTSSLVALDYGGTGADLSGTGGSGQYVKQASAGAAFTVGTIPAGDVPNLAASKITSGTLDSARLPTADETTVGALEVATTAETTAFTLDTKIVTPSKLGDAIPATPAADLGLRLDGSGNIVLPAEGGVQLSGDSGYTGVSVTLASATYYGRYQGRRANGSIGSETAAQADDILVHLGGRGYDGSSWPSAANAAINLHAEENFTGTDQGTYIAFLTTPTGSTTAAEAARVNAAGNLVFADGNNVQVDRVRARNGDGLELFDDGGNGITIVDGGNIQYNFDITISADTSDTSDDAILTLAGGGDYGATRGAGIRLYGNEAGNTGDLILSVGNVSGAALRVFTGGSENFNIDENGDVYIGTTQAPGGTSGKVLIFGDNAGDPQPGTNTAGIYAKDVSGTVEMFAVDEADNTAQLTPHNYDGPVQPLPGTLHWSQYHQNRFAGIEKWYDIERALMALEALTGETYIHSRALPRSERLNWRAVQRERMRAAMARGEDYQVKPIPDWLKGVTQ